MVRFTLKDSLREFSIKMDVPGDDRVSDLREAVAEVWGEDEVLFVKGYDVLDPDMPIGRVLEDGDVIDVLPDLRCLRKY